MRIQSLNGAWVFRQVGVVEWLPAQVPGSVHTDLLALGCIPDPFAGDNEKSVAWVAEADWEYHLQFVPEPELLRRLQIWLVCNGLDTLATVSLNGSLLGHAANMFRQYRWDVKPLLVAGENDLRIVFDSPVRYAAAKQAVRPLVGVPQAIPGGPYLRKAPCQFGWDWGPQLPPIGIWKDIRLEGCEGARIVEVRFSQQHSASQAVVTAELAIQSWGTAPCSAALRLTAPDGQLFQAGVEASSASQIKLEAVIPAPQLWWPNGYGAQPLYRASVELFQAGDLVERREVQLGLRTLELRQELDEWGRSFRFVVNGLPINAKGANWIPADSFPTRITDSHLEGLIHAAAQANHNMLRVWGGGFYEEELFYDLCDRYGILVWQDFIFSCSIYPLDDPDFVENVRHEVLENVRRLRHRASLALWCGNNEMEQGWVEWGWKELKIQDLKAAYDEFFHKTLPAWCAAEDAERSYWPSSPSSGTPFEDPNDQRQGDAHYWDVWHRRKPFTAYRDQFPRFMSEFGFQALPPLATIRTFAQEADWNITSYIMECHQKNDRGNELIITQMLDSFRLPKDFDALVFLSMVLQSEGIRYGVEHWRRHPRRVAGTLYWQFNDCWPVASWSSLDYFGRWKALHYAARRFYASLLLSIADMPPVMDVHLTSDLHQPWDGIAGWSLETLDGKVLDSGEAQVKAVPFDAMRVFHLDFSDRITRELRRQAVFIAELKQDGHMLSRQTAFFVPTKHLALADSAISAQLHLDQGVLNIELTSRSLARLVECRLDGADAVFSDNYFDLPAGRVIRISTPLPAGWSLAKAQANFVVRSIYDSFAHGAEN